MGTRNSSLRWVSRRSLQWRHNEHDGVSNHQPHECLLNCLFRHIWKKTSKLRVTGLCEGNSSVTSEFPAQRASNAENGSIWWRHHDILYYCNIFLDALRQPPVVVLLQLQGPTRPLHTLSLAALGLSAGCDTCPPIGCHHCFVISCSKHRLGLPQSQRIVGSCDRREFSPFFRPLTVPSQSPTRGKCLPLGLCKGLWKSLRPKAWQQWTTTCKHHYLIPL